MTSHLIETVRDIPLNNKKQMPADIEVSFYFKFYIFLNKFHLQQN